MQGGGEQGGDGAGLGHGKRGAMGYGGHGVYGVGVREKERERSDREARERNEVTSPLPSTPPLTLGCIGRGDQLLDSGGGEQGWGTGPQRDGPGTPAQSHMSPSIL